MNIAWLAGILEGEGSFVFRKPTNKSGFPLDEKEFSSLTNQIYKQFNKYEV